MTPTSHPGDQGVHKLPGALRKELLATGSSSLTPGKAARLSEQRGHICTCSPDTPGLPWCQAFLAQSWGAGPVTWRPMCPPSSELPLCYPICPRPLGPANKLHHTVLGLRDPFPVTLQKEAVGSCPESRKSSPQLNTQPPRDRDLC